MPLNIDLMGQYTKAYIFKESLDERKEQDENNIKNGVDILIICINANALGATSQLNRRSPAVTGGGTKDNHL